MAISYCTLQQAKVAGHIETTTGEFETYFTAVYDQVTRRIDHLAQNNTFAPRIETRYFDAKIPTLKNQILYLNYPLLSLTGVTLNGTAATVGDFEVEQYNGNPIMSIYSQSGWSFTDTYRRAIGITGIWGYRRYYSQDGWLSVTQVNNGAGYSASATSIIVDSAASIDIGDMLQIGSEWLSVSSKTVNTLTVTRGIRGSTAATISDDTAVSRWTPEPDIVNAAALMTLYGYKRRGEFQQVEFEAAGGFSVTFPPDQPRTVHSILSQYRLGYAELV